MKTKRIVCFKNLAKNSNVYFAEKTISKEILKKQAHSSKIENYTQNPSYDYYYYFDKKQISSIKEEIVIKRSGLNKLKDQSSLN